MKWKFQIQINFELYYNLLIWILHLHLWSNNCMEDIVEWKVENVVKLGFPWFELG
jgi:hypothetical protein